MAPTLREILVLGGTHGEEVPGIELVKSLQRDCTPGVYGNIANDIAVEAGERFIDENLALCYPGAWETSLERRVAHYIIRICFAYDLVIDVHSCESPGGQYAIIGERTSRKRAPGHHASWYTSGARQPITRASNPVSVHAK